MRRSIVLLILSTLLLLGLVGPAAAHVHGITPLLDLDCTGVDNTVTGGNGVTGTPADSGDGGPITGLIPSNVGSADLTGGDGGRNAVGDTVCP